MDKLQLIHPTIIRALLLSSIKNKIKFGRQMKLPIFLSGSRKSITQEATTVNEIDNYQVMIKEATLLKLIFDTKDSAFEGWITIYNGQSDEVISRNIQSNRRNQQLQASITSGCYDIEVKATTNGSYKLISEPKLRRYQQPENEKITILELGVQQQGETNRESGDGKQLYRISLAEGGELGLTIGSVFNVSVTLYNEKMVIQNIRLFDSRNENVKARFLLEAGTYYLTINAVNPHRVNNYTFSTTFQADEQFGLSNPPIPTCDCLKSGMQFVKGLSEPSRQVRLEIGETDYNGRTDKTGRFKIKTPSLVTNQQVKVYAYAVNGISSESLVLSVDTSSDSLLALK